MKTLDRGKGLNIYEDIPMIVAVDLDGVLLKHNGDWDIDWVNMCKDMQSNGIELILWTCRNTSILWNRVEELRKMGLEFGYVNENVKEVRDNYQSEGRKIFAHKYIDDQMAGYSKLSVIDMIQDIYDYRDSMEYYKGGI